MKIREMVERECCNPKLDFRKASAYGPDYKFCIRCGQVWKRRRVFDAAGGWEDTWVQAQVKEE